MLASFPGQFRSEPARSSGAAHVTIHDSLPRTRLLNGTGPIGWLIGFATLGEECLGRRLTLDIEDFTEFEAWRRMLVGRFVIIATLEEQTRLYPDASASMSVVYSERLRQFASTSGLIAQGGASINHELVALLDIPAKDNWYPFGLTDRHDVSRLLPHHYLDLASFRAVRFRLPKSARIAAFRQSPAPARTVAMIFDCMQAAYKGLAGSYNCTITLTAGHDSRMVLAAALAADPRATCYTYEAPDGAAFGDVMTARTFAHRLRFKHQTISFKRPSQADIDHWEHRIGHCIGGRVSRAVTSMNGNMRDRLVVNGLGGEVGRGALWKVPDFTGARMTPRDLLTRLRLPENPQLRAAAAGWLDTFDAASQLDMLAYAFIELRLGCWAGPTRYGMLDEYGVSLFNSEEIFDLFLSLPRKYRFSQQMYGDFMTLTHPVLRSYPVNRIRRKDEFLFALKQPRKYLRMRARMRGWID